MLWTLSRDDTVPFSRFVSHVSRRLRNPFNAGSVVGCICTILGLIYIESVVAFNAFIGVFAILTTMCCLAAILAHFISCGQFVKPDPFWMKAIWGYIISGIACGYIIVFSILYMFPYSMPATVKIMNTRVSWLDCGICGRGVMDIWILECCRVRVMRL